jgi:hypothetical protein
LVGCLVTAVPGEAAQIYNQTSYPIYIFPGMCVPGTAACVPAKALITIQPGQRSDSLNWTSINAVGVMTGNVSALLPLCGLDFGYHAEIQGGNYMIVDQSNCTVFDTNNSVVKKEKAVVAIPGRQP